MKKTEKSTSYPGIGLILLAFTAFIALGMPDGVLGVAWPSLRADFGLPLDAIGLLLAASTAGYLTSTFMSGLLVGRLGIGTLLAASCALTGAGLIGYTLVPAWWMMVLLGVAAGLGAGAIDAGLKEREHDLVVAQLDDANRRIGELVMEIEILRKERQAKRPLVGRRSSR